MSISIILFIFTDRSVFVNSPIHTIGKSGDQPICTCVAD